MEEWIWRQEIEGNKTLCKHVTEYSIDVITWSGKVRDALQYTNLTVQVTGF